MRLRFIPLLVVSLVMLELYVLFLAAESIGSFKVLALIIVTAVLGISYIKKLGLKTITKVRERILTGKNPNPEFIQGLLLAFGGVFLLVPGLISDLIGLLFALPFTRKQIAKYFLGYSQSFFGSIFSFKETNDNKYSRDIIDGEFWEHQDPKKIKKNTKDT